MAYEIEFALLSAMRNEIQQQSELAAIKDQLSITYSMVVSNHMPVSTPSLTVADDEVSIGLNYLGADRSVDITLHKGVQSAKVHLGPNKNLTALAAREVMMMLLTYSDTTRKLFGGKTTKEYAALVSSAWPDFENTPFQTYNLTT